MLYYGDHIQEYPDEVSRLSHLLQHAHREIKQLKTRVRELSKRDDLMAAEQSAEILECKGHQVKDLADRKGLPYMMIGNRRFYRRSQIEKLRDQLTQARG